jgi:hypothetical protein
VCRITTYGTGCLRGLLALTGGCANHVRRLTILSFPLPVLFVAARRIKPFIMNTFSKEVHDNLINAFHATLELSRLEELFLLVSEKIGEQNIHRRL